MTVTNKFIGTIFFLTLTFNSYAGIGLGDWTCKTPDGNEINNFTDLSLYLKNGEVLKGLNKWFFYKDNISGQLYDKTYFSVNEKTFTIDTFKTEQEWNFFTERQHLIPKFWTRWYETDWKFIDDDLLFVAFLSFPISLPLLILFIFISYKAIRKERFNFRKPFTITLTVILALIFVNFLLEQFPQSI